MTVHRRLYPRLASPTALGRLRAWHGMPADAVRDEADAWQPRTRFYEVGDRVEPSTLGRLRRDLRDLALRHGYPGTRRREGLSGFDRAAGLRMLQEPILDVGSDDVWCHLTAALVPDVVVWRWGWPALQGRTAEELPARSFDRYLGGFRNSLRRMWYRLATYGAGDEDPPALFWEDALVSVEERPSIGADPRLASMIFEVARPLREVEPYADREAAMRTLARATCEMAGWRELQTLDDSVLEGVLGELIDGLVSGGLREVAASDQRDVADDSVDPAPVAPDAFEVEITQGALNNSTLNLREAPDGFFPAWAGEAGRNLTFLLDGLGEPVSSDVVPGKRILRARGATRRFFEANDVRAGDILRVTRMKADTFRVQVLE